MATLFPFPSSKAQIRGMSSINWAKVPVGIGLSSMVSKLGTTAYPSLFFHPRQSCFHQCTRFPQDWPEDLLTIPFGVLSSGPRFLGKSERGKSPAGGRQEGGWVKNITRGCNEAWIFHQHYLISKAPLIRHP